MKILYQEVADHTHPECAHTFCVPLSCCNPMYCEGAQRFALEEWGVDLELLRMNHPILPFMGSQGCVISPHLRPLCSLHTCQVNSLGFKPGDVPWTKRYFQIRDQIEELETLKSFQKREIR